MHDLPLLVSVSVALAYALAGGLIARYLGLPTIAGYVAAGVALGPFTPGFRGDAEIIGQLAEFGVILLMFGVGIHFNFRDLWGVRRVAVPGAVAQFALVALVGYGLGRAWGYSVGGAWILGIAVSVSSTVVALRALMDHGWLNTPTGQVAVGWLVVEDLLTVVALVLLPVFFAADASAGGGAAWLAVGKAVLFVALMLVVGDRLVPLMLGLVVRTRSRELFVLVALTVAAGTALASAAFFGVSLALGAFVAGVVVSESPFSQQISADLLPFREAFAVIFFVSVGMLVDPRDVMAQWDRVAALVLTIVVVKGIAAGALGALLPTSGRTALVLATTRGQSAEFSFIIAQSGLALGLIDATSHSLILAAAVTSILINPFAVRLVGPLEVWLRRRDTVWLWLDRHRMPALPEPGELRDHVVIVGCGRVGRHIAEALGAMGRPQLVVESDPARLHKLVDLGVPVLFGDAGNSEILQHAALEHARALVVTLPDDGAALAVVATAKQRAPHVQIVARASTWDGANALRAAGVKDVVRPELEGGLEIVRRTLVGLDLPAREIEEYTDLVRREGLEGRGTPTAERVRVLDDLMRSTREMEIDWLSIGSDDPLTGLTLAESQLRSRTGVLVIAIDRAGRLVTNPASTERLQAGDRVAIIGTQAQIRAVSSELTERDVR